MKVRASSLVDRLITSRMLGGGILNLFFRPYILATDITYYKAEKDGTCVHSSYKLVSQVPHPIALR